ncbi:MAG: hypothetical protein KKF56_04460 [Nanoarchaeota archaeon]|nr:hypothetical protein [Nanoarchaeota archaeon]
MGVKIKARKIEPGPNEVFVATPNRVYVFPRQVDAFQTAVKFDPANYVLMQQGDIENLAANSAISMIQEYNGSNQEDTIVNVLRDGKFVPTPAQFMPHYRNVNLAVQGRGVLYDAAGNLIEGERLSQYTHTLNHNNWVWLNARFPKGEGHLGLDLVTIAGLNDKGEPVLSRQPLEPCLTEDGLADLDSLNSQGLPTQKSKVNSFEAGKNFYFLHPRQDSAARVNACAERSLLDCYRSPQYSDSRLGGFPCAEGACADDKPTK